MAANDPDRVRYRAPSFKLEFAGDHQVKEAIRDSMARMKQKMKELHKVHATNTDIINTALQYWLDNHDNQQRDFTGNYVDAEKASVDQPLFLCATQSAKNLIQQTTQHNRLCNSQLDIRDTAMSGHVGILIVQCNAGHTFRWMSSPYTPDQKFLANVRLQHGIITSGIRYTQYESIMQAIGMGILSHTIFDATTNIYAPIVVGLTKESTEEALLEEIAEGFHPDRELDIAPDGGINGGITIVTDARHGWRKNANDCDVVAIGHLTHKVVKTVHVTKEDDPCSQRHEMYGTRKLYEYFDACLGGDGVHIKCHGHDCHQPVNKYIREERRGTIGQNDTWHAGKNILKLTKSVTSGAQRSEGITWHAELSDKVPATKTAVQYAIRNCNKNPETLRQNIDNIPRHFQNIHDNCNPQSRCRTQPNYQPSKLLIRDPVALRLFTNALRKSVVYKHPEAYVYAIDTYFVESYNNVLNVYHDKRICFGNTQYEMRTNLTTLDWNENANRPHTSIWQPPLGVGKPKKNLVPKTTAFKSNIWRRFIDTIYQ